MPTLKMGSPDSPSGEAIWQFWLARRLLETTWGTKATDITPNKNTISAFFFFFKESLLW
jgi:hypothetical protein